MRCVLLVPLVLALIGGLVWPVQGQQNRVYPFIELTDADLELIDLHDGSVNDWLDVLGDPVLTGLDFAALSNAEPYDPLDMDFRIWLAWHAATNRIYIAMERVDDLYFNEFNRTDFWGKYMAYDSSLELWMDGDGGRDPRTVARNQSGTVWGSSEHYLLIERDSQHYHAIAETYDEGPQVQMFYMADLNTSKSGHGEWYLHPPYAEGGGGRFGEQPVVTTTEFYMTPFDRFVWTDPAESQVSELSVGKNINFTIVVRDYEGQPKDDFPFLWTTHLRLASWGSGPEFWSDGLLLGTDGAIPEEPEDTAVESVTWGRIKATFDQEIP